MGYVTRFDGEFVISPPMTWAEVRDSKFGPDRFEINRLDLKVSVGESVVEDDDGERITRSGVALVPAYEDEMRGYDIVEHVQQFIDEHPRHELVGRLDCAGEETCDLWRLEIQNGRAVKVQPRIVWPDGTESVPR